MRRQTNIQTNPNPLLSLSPLSPSTSTITIADSKNEAKDGGSSSSSNADKNDINNISKTAESKDNNNTTTTTSTTSIDPLITESNTTQDTELKEILLEHLALQDIRRQLVNRIQTVRITTRNNEVAIADGIRRDRLARLRIEGISDR